MTRLAPVARDGETIGYRHTCPGCNHIHVFYVAPPHTDGTGPVWTFNGSLEMPTVKPSIRIQWVYENGTRACCHYFITQGQIAFLGDCTHALAGRTVPLPEVAVA